MLAPLTELVARDPSAPTRTEESWFLGTTLVLITLTLLWLGWDGWRQGKRVAALEDSVLRLTARQDRLQSMAEGKKTGWGDSLDLTKFNWKTPGPF